eukprot:5389842-Pyramimonas_sp.AAC.1
MAFGGGPGGRGCLSSLGGGAGDVAGSAADGAAAGLVAGVGSLSEGAPGGSGGTSMQSRAVWV